jgi:hypothetical protein
MGYCQLADECRTPISEAHAQQVDETVETGSGEQ